MTCSFCLILLAASCWNGLLIVFNPYITSFSIPRRLYFEPWLLFFTSAISNFLLAKIMILQLLRMQSLIFTFKWLLTCSCKKINFDSMNFLSYRYFLFYMFVILVYSVLREIKLMKWMRVVNDLGLFLIIPSLKLAVTLSIHRCLTINSNLNKPVLLISQSIEFMKILKSLWTYSFFFTY